MSVSREQLLNRRAALLADFHALQGALQFCDQLIALCDQTAEGASAPSAEMDGTDDDDNG